MSITYSLQKQYQQAIDILNEELKIRRELKETQGEAEAHLSYRKKPTQTKKPRNRPNQHRLSNKNRRKHPH